MAYVILKYASMFKGQKVYVTHGYDGHSCELAGVKPGRIYQSQDDAKEDLAKLREVNPSVDFGLVEAE